MTTRPSPSAVSAAAALAVALLGSPLPASAAPGKAGVPSSACAAASRTLSVLHADAATSGRGSDRVPADAKIEDGYRFIALGSIAIRLWPGSDAPLVSLMPDDTRTKAACKVVGPDGTSWLAVRRSDGTLRYVQESETMPERQYDAELSRLQKQWNTWIHR
jgi:hypothetical protein